MVSILDANLSGIFGISGKKPEVPSIRKSFIQKGEMACIGLKKPRIQ